MGLNDENRKSVPIWQFNVARGGCGEYGIVTRNSLHAWSVSEYRTIILDQCHSNHLPTT